MNATAQRTAAQIVKAIKGHSFTKASDYIILYSGLNLTLQQTSDCYRMWTVTGHPEIYRISLVIGNLETREAEITFAFHELPEINFSGGPAYKIHDLAEPGYPDEY